MSVTRLCKALLASIVVAGLVSCAATSSQSNPEPPATAKGGDNVDLSSIYSSLGNAGGKVISLEPQSSVIRIYAFRGGRAAKLAHNHILTAPKFTGFFYLPPGGASAARFDLEFRLDQLEMDDPVLRSTLGSAFVTKLSAEDIEGSRKHMLGEDNLQADRFPFVRIHSLEISGDGTKFATKVQIEMHGQKREMWIPLSVEGLPDKISVTGAFVLRQTDFGAQPYTVLNGLIAVQDEVVVDFKLIGG